MTDATATVEPPPEERTPMTVIDLPQVTPEQARALTDRIKVAVEATWELIKTAYASQAWSALGYASWDDYCAHEFRESRLRLPREERQEVIASLREAGMSTRAIAGAIAMSYDTVQRDLRATDRNLSVGDATPEEEPATVTGVNGKTYKAKAAKASPRPKLTREFTTASGALSRLVARFERLATDDRYRSNRDVIAELCTPEIRRAVQVLDELLRDLAPEQEIH